MLEIACVDHLVPSRRLPADECAPVRCPERRTPLRQLHRPPEQFQPAPCDPSSPRLARSPMRSPEGSAFRPLEPATCRRHLRSCIPRRVRPVGRRAPNSGPQAMSQADEIRQHALLHHVEPGHTLGQRTVTARVRDICRQLGLHGRAPNVYSALQSKVFLRLRGLQLRERTGPRQSAPTCFQYTIGQSSVHTTTASWLAP